MKNEVALILGGADCLHADMKAALAMFTPDHIVATNEAGRDYEGKLDHWCTFHPDKMDEWVKQRAKAGRSPAGTLWKPAHRNHPKGIEMRSITSYGGSSGFLGALIVVKALECKGVLVGVPMQAERSHYHDPKKRMWREAPAYLDAWKQHKGMLRDHIRSMSGWTKEFLGAPTMEWLNAGKHRAA